MKRISITIFFLALLLGGCAKKQEDAPVAGTAPTQLKAAKNAEEFSQYYKDQLRRIVAPENFTPGPDKTSAGVSLPGMTAGDGVFALPGASTAVGAGGGTGNFSGTNQVEADVGEADLVKTDGHYMYVSNRYATFYPVSDATGLPVVSAGKVSVTSTVASSPVREGVPLAIRVVQPVSTGAGVIEIASINLDANLNSVQGMYLRDSDKLTPHSDQLIVIANKWSGIAQVTGQMAGFRPFPVQNTVVVLAFDVSDPVSPVKQWQFTLEGTHVDSRAIDDRLYLATHKFVWPDGLILGATKEADIKANEKRIDELSLDDLMPQATMNSETFSAVKVTDCLLPDITDKFSVFGGALFTLVTLPLELPDQASSLCTLESSNNLYASSSSIYLTRGEWLPDGKTNTVIHKLSFTPSGTEYVASGRIKGSLWGGGEAFRMQEHNGDLRIVTTERFWNLWRADITTEQQQDTTDHYLSVLRQSDSILNRLDLIAQLPNEMHPDEIGKSGERITSVRFATDYAYVVTYLVTDPFYVINLKNPVDPFIEGELELPGYSDYLQPIGDNLLLGVGKDAVVQNGQAWNQGIKVGLFDVTDKSAPRAIGESLIGKGGSDAAVSQSYKAFSVTHDSDMDLYRIALPVRVHDRLPSYVTSSPVPPATRYDWTYTGVEMFEIKGVAASDPVFTNNGSMRTQVWNPETGYVPMYWGQDPRSVIIDDKLYYFNSNRVWSALWDSPDVVIGPQ